MAIMLAHVENFKKASNFTIARNNLVFITQPKIKS